jgi:hypothetical protein
MFLELASRYDIDYVQTCLVPFSAGQAPRGATTEAARLLGATLGGCFCQHCVAAAGRAGLDLGRVRSELLPLADAIARPTLEQSHEMALLLASSTGPIELLLQNPSLYQWLAFRRNTLTGFFAEVHQRIHAARPGIDLRLNAYLTSNQELSGLDLRALGPHLDSIRSSDYSEQSGDAARLEHKRRWLLAVRRAVGDEMPFLSAIGVRPRATPELNAMDQLWRHVKRDALADRPTLSIDQSAEAACQYILQLSPREWLRKAGVLSGNFWLTT